MTRRHPRKRARDDKRVDRRRVIGVVEGNPAVVRGLVVSVLALLASLGVGWAADVDKGTITAVSTIIATLAPIVAALLIRPAVTPNPKVIARVTTQGGVVAGDAAESLTGSPVGITGTGAAIVPVRPALISGL